MSVLALLLPPRDRLTARTAGAEAAGASTKLPAEWNFVLTADGRSAAQQGSAAPALLPRADHVVLVLADADVSWHHIDIPKAPAGRIRAALLGVMEETLLEEDEMLHFALAEGSLPGQPGWVAVTHRPRLAAALAALEAAGHGVERVVAASLPVAAGQPARGHFFTTADAEASPWLSLARPDGVAVLRLNGALARALQPDAASARWTATPAAAAAAEQWLGAPVGLLTEAERALEATAGAGNLRQFDLAPRHRGTRALREAGKRLLSAEWRPVRIGVVALLLLNLIGLNAYAWQQRQALSAKRTAMDQLLKAAHPGVRVVLDAPLQMQRENERLRAAAGRPGDTDLEALWNAAAAAWPDGQGPVQSLRYEAGKLTLTVPGFGVPQLTQFRERLKGTGFSAELNEGRLVFARMPLASGGRS
ncbi:MAG: general secretion pathway protein GspL [Leptothrix sp. (in: Bacteria)]|nr:general secretion pathway protein GspL [Leptothrix sp. (in: b-proteobacteria)]